MNRKWGFTVWEGQRKERDGPERVEKELDFAWKNSISFTRSKIHQQKIKKEMKFQQDLVWDDNFPNCITSPFRTIEQSKRV